jgi:hypothetical protein
MTSERILVVLASLLTISSTFDLFSVTPFGGCWRTLPSDGVQCCLGSERDRVIVRNQSYAGFYVGLRATVRSNEFAVSVETYLATGMTGDGFLGSPLPLLAATDQCLRRPPDIRPGWNRHLATAFRSPGTTARFRTAIPGSKFPAYRFDALLSCQQSRSAHGYFALSG